MSYLSYNEMTLDIIILLLFFQYIYHLLNYPDDFKNYYNRIKNEGDIN